METGPLIHALLCFGFWNTVRERFKKRMAQHPAYSCQSKKRLDRACWNVNQVKARFLTRDFQRLDRPFNLGHAGNARSEILGLFHKAQHVENPCVLISRGEADHQPAAMRQSGKQNTQVINIQRG